MQVPAVSLFLLSITSSYYLGFCPVSVVKQYNYLNFTPCWPHMLFSLTLMIPHLGLGGSGISGPDPVFLPFSLDRLIWPDSSC